MIRIVNAEPLHYSTEAHRILQSAGEVVDGPLTREELRLAIRACDVLIVRLGHRIDREILDAAPHLKAVASATTGLDHVDVEYLREKGIELICLRGEHDFLESIHATAEHTWALLLALVRNIVGASDSVNAGAWDRDSFRGCELHGKRLGIVGMGRVGRKVAGYGAAFGMEVLTHDPYAQHVPEGVHRVDSLDVLAGEADVLSIHVPLDRETAGMIGGSLFRRMGWGSLLINTSRGAVIDEAALIEALESGQLAGAAVDVVVDEGSVLGRAKSPLVTYAKTHANMLITPHIAGATCESMEKTEIHIAERIRSFLGQGPEPEGKTGAGA